MATCKKFYRHDDVTAATMNAMSGATPAQQEALAAEINQLQMKDTLRLYNEMAEMCFNKCVTSFRSKDLGKQEDDCLELCVTKFMKSVNRCGMRFAEEQMQQQQAQMAQMQQQQTQ